MVIPALIIRPSLLLGTSKERLDRDGLPTLTPAINQASLTTAPPCIFTPKNVSKSRLYLERFSQMFEFIQKCYNPCKNVIIHEQNSTLKDRLKG